MVGKMLKYLLIAIFFTRDWLCLRMRMCGNGFINCFLRQRNIKHNCEWFSFDEEEYDSDGSLQTYRIHEKKKEKVDQCYICLELILYPFKTKLLPCVHNSKFHVSCLWKWVMENSVTDFPRYGVFNVSCPICRTTKVVQVCNISCLNRRR